MEDPAMAMPPVEEGPWGNSDIFSEPTDPEMIEYLGRKRESLQIQVGVKQPTFFLNYLVRVGGHLGGGVFFAVAGC